MTPVEIKLREVNQNLSVLLAAVIKSHGGWLVLERPDLEKVKLTDVILIRDGPRKHEILLKVV